ncbi:uncharacterized protein LOC134137641 [Rhea pennata]|uniref:uncharacterized protein LOC134137641 n=1 Tax=Rhea pennata TaxID=8795 RepID=UPI002E26E253
MPVALLTVLSFQPPQTTSRPPAKLKSAAAEAAPGFPPARRQPFEPPAAVSRGHPRARLNRRLPLAGGARAPAPRPASAQSQAQRRAGQGDAAASVNTQRLLPPSLPRCGGWASFRGFPLLLGCVSAPLPFLSSAFAACPERLGVVTALAAPRKTVKVLSGHIELPWCFSWRYRQSSKGFFNVWKARKEMNSSTNVETKKGLSSRHVKRKSKKQFSENVNEPMVLKPTSLVESYLDQSLQISSLNKDGMLDELQMLGDITKHLNQIINSLENIYKKDVDVKEEDAQEDSSWFGKEAQLMEELGEEEHAADSVLPMADKSIVEGISKLTLCIQRLEKLKSCIQNLPGHAPPSVVKQELKKDQQSKKVSSSQTKKESEKLKMQEDLLKAQEHLHVLQREKVILEEKLKKALQNGTLETHLLEKKNLPWTQKEVVDDKERLPLIIHMNKVPQVSTLSLAEAGLNTEDRLNKVPKLLESLESNLKDLQEELALTDDQKSNVSESCGYELKRILAASLESKLKDLQQIETFIADQLGIRGSDEKQVYDIPQTRRLLLSSLEPTLKDLQMAEANIISLPDSINEDRLKEFINQKNILLSAQEANSQRLQQAQTTVVDQEDQFRFFEKKIQDLTEKRKLLLTNLASNWKDLQQTRALAASQLHGMNVGNKVKDLIKERETLVTEIEENLKSLQEVENVVTNHLVTNRLIDNCLGNNSDLFERKSEVPRKWPLNSRTLQLERILSALPLDQDRSSENELLAQKNRILLPNLPSALSSVQSTDKSIAATQPTYDRETTSPVQQMMPSKVVSSIHFDFSVLPALIPEGRVQKASEIELPQKRKLVKKTTDISENKRDSDASTPYQRKWEALFISGKSYPLLSSRSQEAKRR